MKIPHKFFTVLFLALSTVSTQAYNNDCGNDGQNDCDCPPGGVGTNPINPQKGNLMRSVTDLQTFGAAPIVFSRIYNSRTREYTKPRWELGTVYTWQHNWQYEMRESSTLDFGFPRLIIRYPEGREYYFRAVNSTGAVRVSDASWGDRLYPTGTGTYTLRSPEGREYDFRKVGTGSNYQYLLEQVRTGTGWKWILTYQTQADGKQRLYRITNNYGRYLQLNRTAGANGYYQITSVAANDGRTVSYGYTTWAPTSETVLTSVTYPDATAAAYTWCGASSLTSGPPLLASANDPMQNSSGSRMKYAYNYTAAYFGGSPFGIVNGTVLSESNQVTNQVVVSLPLGSGTYPKVLEGNGTELTRKYSLGLSSEFADGEGRTTTIGRDTGGAGYILTTTDNDGGVTTFTRDYAGRVLTRTNPMSGVRTYTYNANGFLLTEQDEEGRTTTHTRDANNRITRTDHPDGAYETFTYTGTGLLKNLRLRNGFTAVHNYDSSGNLSSLVDAAGYTWTYTYHGMGQRASVTDPRTHTTNYVYNWRGLLTKFTHPDGSYRQYGYSTYGKLISETNELSHAWTSTYTEYNQLATTTDPLNHTTTYEYGREPGCTSCGYLPMLSKIILPSGKVTENHYDLSGKLLSRTTAPGTPDESTTSFSYGDNGLPETMTDARGKVTSYTYDPLDRKKTETDPLGHTTEWDYDNVGNLLKVTRADSSEITNTYDTMNRLLTTTNPKSETTTYTYHPDGSMASLKDQRNNTYTFLVDSLSRRTRMTYPGSSYESWTYDGAGNMTVYRARNAATQTCTYDNRDRNTLYDWSDTTPDTSKTYDLASRLLTLTSNGVALSYVYTDTNGLQSETYGFGGVMGNKTVNYTYDVDSNRQTLVYPDGTTIDYTYTGRNQVKTLSADGPPPLATFGYDPAGHRLTKALENGTLSTSSYDDAGRFTSIVHKLGATIFANAYYTYNDINLRISGEAGDTYEYDAADQLSRVVYDTLGDSTNYTYDGAGNRLTTENAATTSYSANALNQYVSITGLPTPGYDANGNLYNLTDSNYSYDSANRLIGSENPGADVLVDFVRDGRNRICKRTINSVTTYQIYDGWEMIAEYDASGNPITKYVHGPRVDEILAKIDALGTVFYHENALGSTIALSNSVGVVAERYVYDAFGKVTFLNPGGIIIPASTQNNRFLFTGREWLSELDLYDYRSRTYSSLLGRFLQTDPIGFSAEDVNLYRYVSNNPSNWIDPTGLLTELRCTRCEDDPSGPMNCQLYKDGEPSGDPFTTNENGYNPDSKGPIPKGDYDLQPKPEDQMDEGNKGKTGNVEDGKVDGEYPQGTPSITQGKRAPGNIKGGRNNLRVHPPGEPGAPDSDGCIATDHAGDIQREMEKQRGHLPLNISEICCDKE